MSLEPGVRIGVHEIVGAIGAGGMGEVYRAHDTVLGRDVAIKVLPDAFAADAERLARFEREARVLASLNHPNIAAIYGIERTPSATALIMELASGETLAARFARGPVSIDDALPIALQIAAALEAAHDKGIVHRDLKPANIVVAPDGKVKVLDFGLAKLVAADAPAIDVTHSPTMAHAGTLAGVLLGTAAYMSPEQARGKVVDKRADIWAFGCVLFEMLTGRPAFPGETITDIVAAVVKNEPDWSALPTDVPASARRLMRRCLAKDPSQRLRDAADARLELAEPPGDSTARPTVNSPAWRRALSVAAAAACAAAVTALLLRGGAARGDSTPRVTRLEFDLPTGVELYGGNAPGVAFAPDGRRVAFIGITEGERRLYVRSLDHFDGVALRGTEQVQSLVFAPDGSSIAFMTADRSVKTTSLSDGLVTVIAHNADQYSGATWGPSGITYSVDGHLVTIAPTGGTPRQLTTLDAARDERFHIWPFGLPGGKAFLFRSIGGEQSTRNDIEALDPGTGQRKVLVSGLFPMFASSGHLIFCRDQDLLAAPFDVDRLQITGPTVRAISDVGVDLSGAPLAGLSATGSLIYAPGGTGTSHLVWVSRDGAEQPVTDSATRYQSPRLAPDGKVIALVMGGNLWLHDIARNTLARANTEPTVGSGFTVWVPDGKHVAFRSRRGIRLLDVERGASVGILDSRTIGDIPNSVSPDGESLLFTRQNSDTSGDIYIVSLRDGSAPRPIVKTAAYEGGAQFSPDGRWIAYVSNESGRFEVYLRPYAGPGRRWSVSTLGGSFPLWRRDGKELFYRSGNKMMAVSVSASGDDVSLSTPRVLFDRRYTFETSTIANYDISLDGSRFLMVKDDFGAGRLNVILNWTEELKRLAPTR